MTSVMDFKTGRNFFAEQAELTVEKIFVQVKNLYSWTIGLVFIGLA